MNKRTILVTGGSGFVGGALCRALAAQGVYNARAAVRRAGSEPEGIQSVVVDALSNSTDWGGLLGDVDSIVHAAARVHVMQEVASDSLAEFRRANVEGTLNLARQAATAGVRRFIFISSVKVNGESSQPGCPLRADDPPMPQGAYAVSKYEAEQGLLQLAATVNMELVVIRPVLVYGPGVKANFHSMMRWVQRGVPLPFGALDNRRSLVYVENLVDLLITCIDHPRAARQILLASDAEALPVTELLRVLSRALGCAERLVPVPVALLRLTAGLFGQRDLAQRLLDSLQVDITKNSRLLGWRPPYSLEQGLQKTARSFLERSRP